MPESPETTEKEVKATIVFRDDGTFVFLGDNARVAAQKMSALFTQKGATTENIWTLFHAWVLTEDGKDKSSVLEFLSFLDKV